MILVQNLVIIFVIIALGVICEKRKVFNHSQIEGFELFLFKVGIPCYLFTAVLKYDLSVFLYPDYIYSYLLSFLAMALVAACYFHNNSVSQITMKILASGYVNAAIYSIPVITFLFNDPSAAILGNLIQVIIIQTIFVTLLSLLNHHEKSVSKRIFASLSSPLVAMPIIALLLNYFQLQPNITSLTDITRNLGNGASGMALFTFGLSLGSVKISKYVLKKELIFIIFTKNILHPIAAFLVGCYVFHLDRYWFYSLIITASAPTAFVVYLIAKQFSIEQEKIKMIVALSSIISLITLTFITLNI
ncbi:hypothetical protein NF27_BK00700 [Candidatus Jidaibacter acanthamoeba]|uniref:Uncharacterized protein n=1 Tax=Candidatus Jidaibacter acanthamoebae TaxID=86105 RepID=A0A0C1QKX5_9RICK|nr:AEC family transporter [Candidatus Jidaibacter acanthamoeba]KIE06149.1 hypothetical protein NF27_BK00700 [Candidatus Jidaibacter acanthamoeba]